MKNGHENQYEQANNEDQTCNKSDQLRGSLLAVLHETASVNCRSADVVAFTRLFVIKKQSNGDKRDW